LDSKNSSYSQIGLGLRPRPILAVLGIFFIQLFPNWTACSPITYTNLTPNFPGVYNFVVWIPVDTKATAFELELLRLRLIRVSRMRKSALLAAGNLMLSNYISALNDFKPIKLSMSMVTHHRDTFTFPMSVFYFS